MVSSAPKVLLHVASCHLLLLMLLSTLEAVQLEDILPTCRFNEHVI